jgi:Holliday junction DNA helicase RuvB
MGTTARLVSAPLVADAGQLVVELLRLTPGAVLFIDEIHALPRAAMEALYEAVEDRRLTVAVRAGASIRGLTFDLPAFTLVAATNEPEKLPRALISRFAIREWLESYSEDELAEIVARTARREERRFEDEGARVVARASRGSAREAVLLATRVIRAVDGALPGGLDKANAFAALQLLGLDERGLDAGDLKLLETLKKSRKPLGLATLAAKTGIGAATILERHEPFLLRLGLVEITALGRVAC